MDESDVIMYCRSWCGDCARARRWLASNSIPYTEIDIELVPGAAEECEALAGKIVTPTFRIGDETVVDFDEPRLRELLLPRRRADRPGPSVNSPARRGGRSRTAAGSP